MEESCGRLHSLCWDEDSKPSRAVAPGGRSYTDLAISLGLTGLSTMSSICPHKALVLEGHSIGKK